ncbi:MAG: hypothetical protein FWG56_11500 [Desulfovibrionaceae bacterium]|nr:hypothetical protein [Desulfovibrionaceae bacterium]
MTHWSDHYIGIPYAQMDCAQLVEKVLREQFATTVIWPFQRDDDLERYSGLIVQHRDEFVRPIDVPRDGCGVLMFFRGRSAHMGLYALMGGQGYVLHSDAIFGASVRMPLERVRRLYKIEGFYDWL